MKLSVIGLETTHGYIYPAMINGYDPEAMQRNALDIVSGIFPTGGAPSVDPLGVKVVACYDPDPAVGQAVAEACKIERVCSELADAYRDVDGVIITAGDARRISRWHGRRWRRDCRPSSISHLRRQLPTRRRWPSWPNGTTRRSSAPRRSALPDRRRHSKRSSIERVGQSLGAHVIGTGRLRQLCGAFAGVVDQSVGNRRATRFNRSVKKASIS